MPRGYYNRKTDDLPRFVAGILALFIVGLVSSLIQHPEKAGEILLPFFVLGAFIYLVRFLIKKIALRHFENILEDLSRKGLDQYINNFLDRFSFESNRIEGFTYRNRRIDWDRLNDLEKYLINQGVPLKTGKNRDMYELLRYFIQSKEEKLTTESLKTSPQRFSLLSGTDFEKLLYRLFEKMGYKVEWIGHSGDQGGDLIANREGERILIQAKCYRDWSTGNEAVQQVVGAMKYYGCNRSMVVSTSKFTQEAYALGRANNTDLISKDRLSELLLQYLGESWA